MPSPEFPADLSRVKSSTLGESSRIRNLPINEFDALMRTAPGEPTEMTVGELQQLREAVVDCVERITPEHRFILESIFSERLSVRQLAPRLGLEKSQTDRLVQRAKAELRHHLTQHPHIRGRIRMYSTWQEAARSAVLAIAPNGIPLDDDVSLGMIDRKIDALRAVIHSGNVDSDSIVPKLRTIGVAAAMMLDNAGAWSVDDMVNLLCRKQHDYGHGNINAFGLVGLVVRTSDKVARYHNLLGREGHTEPRIDALVDMVGYAVIGTMLEDNSFQLPMSDEEVAG